MTHTDRVMNTLQTDRQDRQTHTYLTHTPHTQIHTPHTHTRTHTHTHTHCHTNCHNDTDRYFFIYSVEFAKIQTLTKDSIVRQWKNALSHDWIPKEKAKTFPLHGFNVRLEWSQKSKEPLQNTKKFMRNFSEVFNDTLIGEKAVNVLVEGKFICLAWLYFFFTSFQEIIAGQENIYV